MKKWYRVQENGVNLVFLVTEKGEVFFVHCQKSGFEEKEIPEDQLEGYRLVQLQAAGEDQDDHHGAKYTGTLPGCRLIFDSFLDERKENGRRITITQKDPVTGLLVKSCL